MHPNPTFRSGATDRSLALVRDRGFGTLAVNGPDGPHLSHVPLLLSEDGSQAHLHLVRSNPIARGPDAQAAVIAVQGPDGYVSPNWYGVDDQVPTWNYVAVHLRGILHRMDQAEMRAVLDRQTEPFEAHTNPATPWTSDKMTPDALDRMMRQIVPFRLAIDTIDATWKLSQNKPDAVRHRAADAMARAGIGTDTEALAALMHDEGPDR